MSGARRARGPERLWVADLTCVATWSGWDSIAFVMDDRGVQHLSVRWTDRLDVAPPSVGRKGESCDAAAREDIRKGLDAPGRCGSTLRRLHGDEPKDLP